MPSNMQLKSVVAALLLRTWQPVTWLAYATQAPERPRRLTECYRAGVVRTYQWRMFGGVPQAV